MSYEYVKILTTKDIDKQLSETSTNPVQNKVIAAKIAELEAIASGGQEIIEIEALNGFIGNYSITEEQLNSAANGALFKLVNDKMALTFYPTSSSSPIPGVGVGAAYGYCDVSGVYTFSIISVPEYSMLIASVTINTTHEPMTLTATINNDNIKAKIHYLNRRPMATGSEDDFYGYLLETMGRDSDSSASGDVMATGHFKRATGNLIMVQMISTVSGMLQIHGIDLTTLTVVSDSITIDDVSTGEFTVYPLIGEAVL